MKKSISNVFFCIMMLPACGGGGGDPAGGDPGGENQQKLSLNSIGNQTVLAGETLNFTLSASDPNGTSHTYTADGTNNTTNPLSLIDRVSFNETTGAFHWDSSPSDNGNYNMVFSVTNDASPPESDSESITIIVQNVVAYGEDLYIQYCQSCHGPNGANGNQSIVQGSSPLDVRYALGLEGGSARSGMGNIASQFENQTRDANAIGYFLCDAGGIDINNTQQCPVN